MEMSAKKSSTSRTEPLACPSCALRYGADERFCSSCGMPLVHAGADADEAPVSDAHEKARKINPVYTEGELVRVAGGRNQAEAELIQGLLIEEGVPSMLRRSGGFDVPDFLAAGPRDVLVPQAGAEAAREVLLQADLAPAPAGPRPRPKPLGLVVAIVAGGLVSAGVAWLLVQLAG
jgi:hypothetical protein